jgi:glutamate/aspartate transport system ATP-binding protein
MDEGAIVEDVSKNDFFEKPQERSERAKYFLSKIISSH